MVFQPVQHTGLQGVQAGAVLAVGVGVSDIVRFSPVKYERGTSYPYSRTINLVFRPTF